MERSRHREKTELPVTEYGDHARAVAHEATGPVIEYVDPATAVILEASAPVPTHHHLSSSSPPFTHQGWRGGKGKGSEGERGGGGGVGWGGVGWDGVGVCGGGGADRCV